MPLPTPPGMRVAYHEDGSLIVGWYPGLTGPVTLNNTQARNLNSFTGASLYGHNVDQGSSLILACVFPEQRDLKGLYLTFSHDANDKVGDIYTSVDTTNGQDGTWVDSGVDITAPQLLNCQATYRTGITTVSVNGVRGVRVQNLAPGRSFVTTAYVSNFHVYADTLAATASDRLQLWHPTLDQPITVTDFDAGDVQRGSSTDKTFRLKNVSVALTAQGSGVTVGISGDSSPSLLTQVLVSNDGTNFAATASVGDLAPGALSSVLTVRYNISMSQPLGAWSPYILPTVTSWA
jgi:hypothetical protein